MKLLLFAQRSDFVEQKQTEYFWTHPVSRRRLERRWLPNRDDPEIWMYRQQSTRFQLVVAQVEVVFEKLVPLGTHQSFAVVELQFAVLDKSETSAISTTSTNQVFVPVQNRQSAGVDAIDAV